MAIPIPSQCAVEQHEEALRFCLTVLLFYADVFHFVNSQPNVEVGHKKEEQRQCRVVLFGNCLFREFVIYIIYYHSLIY